MHMPSNRWRALVVCVVTLAACGCSSPPAPSTPTATPASTDDSASTATPSETDEPFITEQPATPIVIQIDLGQPPDTLDPTLVGPLDAAGNDLVENLFVGLTYFDPDTGGIGPALARGWEVSDDGLTWVVSLHDDAWWSHINPTNGQLEPTRQITAADVVYSVQRACRFNTQAPLAPALFVIQGCQAIYESTESPSQEFVDGTLGVRVLNNTTVEFKLALEAAYFPTIMSMAVMRPVPADLVESLGQSWTEPENIWVSGGWVVQPAVPAEEGYTLVKNTVWFLDEDGNIDVLHVSFDALSGQGFTGWQAGELALSEIPPQDIAALPLSSDPAYRLMARPVVSFLAISHDTPPLDNPDLRRALSLALDRQVIVDQALMGLGLPAPGFVPPGVATAPGDDAGLGSGFDPDAARAALAAAGYEGCAWLPSITLLSSHSELSGQLATLYVDMWQDVLGCAPDTFLLEQEEWHNLLHVVSAPPAERQGLRPGLVVMDWQGDYPDAHHWLADVFGCRELFPGAYLDGMRACVEADTWVAQAATLQDGEQRAALYQAAEGSFFGPSGEMPIIPVYVGARPLAIQPWLTVYPVTAGPLRFDRWVVDVTQAPWSISTDMGG